MRSKIDDDEFIKISANSRSMREAALKMQYSFSAFKKRAIKLGCYKTNQGWSKGKTTFDDYRIRSKYKIYDFNSIFCENSNVHRGSLKKIIIINKLIEYKCIKCENSGIWEGKKLFLQLDHINGIRNDNRIENLRFLCPNCHSQTDTFCGYNIKNKNLKKLKDIDLNIIENEIITNRNIGEVVWKLGVFDCSKNRKFIEEYKRSKNLLFKDEKFSNRFENMVCECGAKKYEKSSKCIKCYQFSNRKVERPSYEQLLCDLNNMSYISVGKKYGVSDNAIRKWIKNYRKETLTDGVV